MEENKEIFDKENLQNEENINHSEVENEVQEENIPEEKSTEELLKEEKERYIRLFAEFENYRKRTIKEKNEFFKYANQDIMTALISIFDDFDRAIKEMNKRGNDDDVKGIELIYQKFKTLLKEKGIRKIEVNIGDDFDVDKHEAITKIPAPSEELKGKIVDVVQTGYFLHDRVIRFAKVVVGA